MNRSHFKMYDRLSLQMLRYLLVGFLAWLVDFLTFTLLFSTLGVVWAQAAARINGALVGFIGHKVFVFEDRRNSHAHMFLQGAKYLLLWIASYGLSTAGILWLMDLMTLHAIAAKLLVEMIVIAINFVAMKRLIFAS